MTTTYWRDWKTMWIKWIYKLLTEKVIKIQAFISATIANIRLFFCWIKSFDTYNQRMTSWKKIITAKSDINRIVFVQQQTRCKNTLELIVEYLDEKNQSIKDLTLGAFQLRLTNKIDDYDESLTQWNNWKWNLKKMTTTRNEF